MTLDHFVMGRILAGQLLQDPSKNALILGGLNASSNPCTLLVSIRRAKMIVGHVLLRGGKGSIVSLPSASSHLECGDGESRVEKNGCGFFLNDSPFRLRPLPPSAWFAGTDSDIGFQS